VPRPKYFLYFATRAAADHAAQRARRAGYETTVQPPAQTDAWALVAKETDAAVFDDGDAFFEQLADLFEGEYDGSERPV
jgi:hypothetical protein